MGISLLNTCIPVCAAHLGLEFGTHEQEGATMFFNPLTPR